MNILFVFTLGSEVRQFLHSDIISSLLNDNHQVFVSIKDIKELKKEILSCEPRVKIIYYSDVTLSRSFLSYYQELLDQVFEKDLNLWKYVEVKSKKPSFILKILITLLNKLNSYKLLKKLENYFYKKRKNSFWEKLLAQNEIDRVIVNTPNNALLPLIAAYKLKVERVLLYHTNKDISAQGRFKVEFNKIGVWNLEMEKAFIEKYGKCKKSDLKVIGNSHFSFLDNPSLLLSESAFNNRFCISKKDHIILYTAAAPWVIKNEKIYIDLLKNALKDNNLSDFKIIVRVNPMDFSNEWDKLESDSVIIQHPKWFWNKPYNINFTLKEDLEEFYSILYYSECCINIPSSVTIEAAIMKLPVINICFDCSGIEVLNNGKVADFWHAPFNKLVIKNKSAFPCFSYNDLKEAMKLLFVENKNLYTGGEQDQFIKETLNFPVGELKNKSEEFIIS